MSGSRRSPAARGGDLRRRRRPRGIDRPEAVASSPASRSLRQAVRDILAGAGAGRGRKSAERFSWERNATELAAHLKALVG